jgi:hypothetical protein
VRVEGVVLEHHGDVAVLGRHVVDDAVADLEDPIGDLLEARDHAQGGRLAAARRADEDHELLVRDGQVEVPDRRHVAETLVDALQHDLSHCGSSVRIRPSP